MPERRPGAHRIRPFLLEQVDSDSPRIVGSAAKRFGLSRQAVHLHLAGLQREGFIVGEGRTRARRYRLALLADENLALDLPGKVDEDALWRERFAPAAGAATPNVLEICRFGFTEILGNAALHSGATRITVRLRRTAAAIEILVADKGRGFFESLALDDASAAALEIAKGGLTSDPARRSGRGLTTLFRAFDDVSLWSGHYQLRSQSAGAGETWNLTEHAGRVRGMTVGMRIRLRSPRTLSNVLDRFAVERDGSIFPRAEVPVRLGLVGSEQPMTRSQARGILARLDFFREALLDFSGILTLGPAFADEVFRVFPRQQPGVVLRFRGASPSVERSIRRASEERPLGPS